MTAKFRNVMQPAGRHRVLVVMGRDVDPARDSGVAIIEEALMRGLRVDVCAGADLCFTAGGAAAEARAVHAAGVAGLALEDPAGVPLTRYDAILIRTDPPFDAAALEATLLLEHARGRALMINDPRGLREVNEKLFALRFAAFAPPTAVLREPAAIHAFCIEQGGVCVVKPLDGCGGRGVFVLRADDPNAGVIVDVATGDGRRRVIVQAWLPVTETGDKRIFLLDGEPAGALLRMPSGSDVRANLCRGGCAHATTLTAREREIASAVGAACRALGLVFVGIDVIDGRLTEVNVTSPTGLRELEQLTGRRVQAQIVDWMQARFRRDLRVVA